MLVYLIIRLIRLLNVTTFQDEKWYDNESRSPYFGAMVHGQVVRRPVINHVLLPRVISPISQSPISLVSWIGVKIMHLIVDPGCHGVVKRLVVDIIVIIATRIEMILPAQYRPVILVLVRALINTNHGCVIRFTRPFRRLENG